MPHSEEKSNEMPVAPVDSAYIAPLLIAIQQFQGAIVLVGNEIGLGVIPMGREVREYVDALGLLNQQVAASCERVTLMAAGLPLKLKEPLKEPQ
jgi:adenosylcobinamide kinase/adenosylcobinamide-phosphate guanylyltransferase